MKWHIIYSVLFLLALVAPLVWSAAVEPIEAVEAAKEAVEDAARKISEESSDSSASVDSSAAASAEVLSDYIDVSDHTPAAPPWWF